MIEYICITCNKPIRQLKRRVKGNCQCQNPVKRVVNTVTVQPFATKQEKKFRPQENK